MSERTTDQIIRELKELKGYAQHSEAVATFDRAIKRLGELSGQVAQITAELEAARTPADPPPAESVTEPAQADETSHDPAAAKGFAHAANTFEVEPAAPSNEPPKADKPLRKTRPPQA